MAGKGRGSGTCACWRAAGAVLTRGHLALDVGGHYAGPCCGTSRSPRTMADRLVWLTLMARPDTMTLAVVDDDDDVRTALNRLLRAMGYRVVAFASAEDFEARSVEVDCAIIDMRLPGMSGLELCERLRQRSSPLPVVLVTGDAHRLAADLPAAQTHRSSTSPSTRPRSRTRSPTRWRAWQPTVPTEDRYRRAAAAGGVGVWDWNLATGDIFVDPLLKELLGYGDHEIPNRARGLGPAGPSRRRGPRVRARQGPHQRRDAGLRGRVSHAASRRQRPLVPRAGNGGARPRWHGRQHGRDQHPHHRAQARRGGAPPGRGDEPADRREHRRLRQDPRPRRTAALHQPGRAAGARADGCQRPAEPPVRRLLRRQHAPGCGGRGGSRARAAAAGGSST